MPKPTPKRAHAGSSRRRAGPAGAGGTRVGARALGAAGGAFLVCAVAAALALRGRVMGEAQPEPSAEWQRLAAAAGPLLQQHAELESARRALNHTLLQELRGHLEGMWAEEQRAGRSASAEAASGLRSLFSVLQALPGSDAAACSVAEELLGHPQCADEHRQVAALLRKLVRRAGPRARAPVLHSCPSRYAGPGAAACRRAGRTRDGSGLVRAAQALGVPWVDEHQLPPVFLPGLQGRPWWTVPESGGVPAALESLFPAARRELEALLAEGDDSFTYVDQNLVTAAGGGDWRELRLFPAPGGGWDEGACAKLPSVCRALKGNARIQGVPEDIVSLEHWSELPTKVAVLRLRPGTGLAPHFGGSNMRLVSHLGLSVPRRGPQLHVADTPPRHWEEGKALVFDDSFEHWVTWDDAEPPPGAGKCADAFCGNRYVLACNFWHPDLPVKL
eukprot:TRINITY_DN42270_c0_g1_i1.p1 TRINITY_DN42270_c0_g1~~TRINITY_DN42270_c0_g1_i1.p1  ORF type:complete len:473 (+),score=132.71 TRINITY_DN42270_c0_g1_i1:82-1419(+)